MINEIQKIDELLDAITLEDYEDGEKLFTEYESYNNIYEINKITYEILKNYKKVYDRVLCEVNGVFYGFKKGQITKYNIVDKSVEKGDLILIKHHKTLMGESFKSCIFEVEGVHFNNEIVADHISACMNALYKNDYDVIELVDSKNIDY